MNEEVRQREPKTIEFYAESKSSTKSDDGTEEHDVKERSKTKQKEHKQIKVKKQTMAT